MSLSLGNGVVGECVEFVDELRIHDIQVTGFSVPILVRADGKRFDQHEFVENNLGYYALRNLIQYTESLCKELPINLISVLLQYNVNPILGYSSDLHSTHIKKGGEIESQICSRLAAIFSQLSAPNIVKQLSWFYLFDQKLEFLHPDWNKAPLVQYILYTITAIEDQISQPLCEPTTKWIFCLRGKIDIQLLPPTPSSLAAFRKFLDEDDEDALSYLFQTDSIETHLYRNQVLFVPGGWTYLAKREAQTIEYGGEFYHSFAIDHQFGVWNLYKETFLSESDQTPPPFFTCHWLVLQAYLSSFQDTMLTTQEALFDLEHSRAFMPHFSPFECRGMLFVIELIRSARLPMLRQCIPSSVNCAISLLQKMQTILLHETIFSAFSCPTPNGIMFFGTPKDNIKYIYKSKGRNILSKTKYSSLPTASLNNDTTSVPARLSLDFPVSTADETEASQPSSISQDIQQCTHEDSPMNDSKSDCLNVSIPFTNIHAVPEFPSETSSSNYQSLISQPSKSPNNTPSIHSENSDIVLMDISFPKDNSFEKEMNPVPTWKSLREFLETYLAQSSQKPCGICQFCKRKDHRFFKRRVCIISRIADMTVKLANLASAPPIFMKLVQLICVYPPIVPHITYLKEILRRSQASALCPPSPVKEASLSDIQNILTMLKTNNNTNPISHSTPLSSPSK